MLKCIAMMILMCPLLAQEYPPQWVLDGILYVESRSVYREDGSIKYVVQTRGKDGEYGPFQMTPIAFKQIKKRGEPFWKLETDTLYAEEMACRYLMWLDIHYGNGDWKRNIEMYNAGPGQKSRDYLRKVLHAAGQN
jgi:hypothetical protein